MIKDINLLIYPVIPVFSLLWRMIDRRQRNKQLKNWRTITEGAIYSLVVDALKKSEYILDKAKISSAINIKGLRADSVDFMFIDRSAQRILNKVKNESNIKTMNLVEIDDFIRKLVLESISGQLSFALVGSKHFTEREFATYMVYAVEQVARARELKFEEIANRMEDSMKLALKSRKK